MALKTPTISRNVRAPSTGARFLPGRVARPGAPNADKILFEGEPFFTRIHDKDGSIRAGVAFGPNMEPPTEVDTTTLAAGARVIRAASNARSQIVTPIKVKAGDRDRQQIFQYSLERRDDGVFILPPEDGVFVWQIWTGFYGTDQLWRARTLTQEGKYLHGAGPFLGSQGFTGVGKAVSETGLIADENSIEGLAKELEYRLHMEDGIPLWQAYAFQSRFSSKDSQAVLVRQLHEVHVLTCPGGVPEYKTFAADKYTRFFNEAGIPRTGTQIEAQLVTA